MMKLTLLLLLFCFRSFAQITGNYDVKDGYAIKLDSEAENFLLGKWKLLKTVEFIRNDEQTRDRGMIVDFDKGGEIISSWCVGCYEEQMAEWKVINEQIIHINYSRPHVQKYLAGDWVVYNLTDNEMILAKVLTSNGDWKKLHYFSRSVGTPPTTEVDRYCINCSSASSFCLGDRPGEAMRQFAIVTDLVNKDGDNHQHLAEITEAYDWLFENAPCISNSLYVQAERYYENVLKIEKDEEVRT